MTNEEKQILEAELWKLSPPSQAIARKLLAKCVDEFAADKALNFLRGLPALPMRAYEVSE